MRTLTAIDLRGRAVAEAVAGVERDRVGRGVASVSVRVAEIAVTWESEPLIVRLVVPEPDTPVPVADRSPLASVRVTVKVSPAVLPLSDRLTPAIALAWFCCTVADAGAVIAGSPLTVTAIVAAAARAAVAVAGVERDRVRRRVAVGVGQRGQVALTWVSEPAIVRLSVARSGHPGPGRREQSAAVGQRDREGLAAGGRRFCEADPLIAPGCPTPTVAAAGAVIAGGPIAACRG